jgi:orotate phosphoribosyltransferase
MNKQKLGQQIYKTAHLTGEFLLRSGVISNQYFDKYRFEAQPLLLRQIAEALEPLVPDDVDMLAGLEMGGIPIVTMLSQITGLPAVFVRKQAKEYGTRKLAEGNDIDGKKLLVVEDVVTSGGQVVLSTKDLRERGAIITHAVCVIDRESTGRANLAEIGVELLALFTMSDLVPASE